MKSQATNRQCAHCEADFQPRRDFQKYCNWRCRQSAGRARWDEQNPQLVDATKGTLGALGELVVSADLIRRGFHVFRALSPSCPCDLVILHGGSLLRVEVRTGYVRGDGEWRCATSERDYGRSDVLAIVSRDGTTVTYRPELPEAA